MTRIFRLTCTVLLTVAMSLPALPAAAGDQEVAYLHSLAGDYVGSGTVRGAHGSAKMTCALALKPSGAKLNFSGQCASGDFSGTVTYDDRKKKWVYTSGRRAVIGRKSGRSLIFTTSEQNRNGSGRTTFTFSPGKPSLKFQLQFPGGEKATGTIAFKSRNR